MVIIVGTFLHIFIVSKTISSEFLFHVKPSTEFLSDVLSWNLSTAKFCSSLLLERNCRKLKPPNGNLSLHFTKTSNDPSMVWELPVHHQHAMSLAMKHQILDVIGRTWWYGIWEWQTAKMAMMQPKQYTRKPILRKVVTIEIGKINCINISKPQRKDCNHGHPISNRFAEMPFQYHRQLLH